MWYDYDILPRAQQLPIISGSARTVVDYAAGLASPMHKGGGFIIAHHRLLLSGACERSVGRHSSRITPRLGTGPASAGSPRLRRTVCGVHTVAARGLRATGLTQGGAPLGSSPSTAPRGYFQTAPQVGCGAGFFNVVVPPRECKAVVPLCNFLVCVP